MRPAATAARKLLLFLWALVLNLLLPTATTSFRSSFVLLYNKPSAHQRPASDKTHGICIARTCNLHQQRRRGGSGGGNILLTTHQAINPAGVQPEKRQQEDAPLVRKSKSGSDKNAAAAWQQPLLKQRHFVELAGFVVYCAVAACALIQWEDVTASTVLPSRQPQRTVAAAAAAARQLDDPQHHQTASSWGASTIHGLAFGRAERRILEQSDNNYNGYNKNNNNPLATTLPSYNEIMERHRTVTVPQWRQQQQQQQSATTTSTEDLSSAIHTVVASLQQVWALQSAAEDYQWESTIRPQLHAPPLQDLPAAGAVLRAATSNNNNNNDPDGLGQVVGFDWGSCAWRHCGAVADAQEALDELDQLLGVLEPYEAVFCLDIVERSLRDILAVLPWDRASERDLEIYQKLPPYESRVSVNQNDDDEHDSGGGDNILSRIDDAYFRALQELRID